MNLTTHSLTISIPENMSSSPPFPCLTKHVAHPPELSARGKSVVITGGGSTGIGGETARYFAEAGASRIALLGRREQSLLDNKAWILNKYPGIEVFTQSTDVTQKSEVDSAFAQFGGDGKLDVLIHSAATIGHKEAVTDADVKEYLDAIQINLAGSLCVAQAFVRHAPPDAHI